MPDGKLELVKEDGKIRTDERWEYAPGKTGAIGTVQWWKAQSDENAELSTAWWQCKETGKEGKRLAKWWEYKDVEDEKDVNVVKNDNFALLCSSINGISTSFELLSKRSAFCMYMLT